MIRYIVTGALLGVLALAAVLASTVIAPAEARGLHPRCNIDWPCAASDHFVGVNKMVRADRREARRIARGQRLEQAMPFGAAINPPETQRSFLNRQATILPHPSGCPRRAFCGCGAAVEVFGKPIRSLWLAANWLAFPRTSPAPGMVAARRGHVFVIKQVLGGGKVLAYDANSGGRRTRLHVRSLAGFAVVNPHG